MVRIVTPRASPKTNNRHTRSAPPSLPHTGVPSHTGTEFWTKLPLDQPSQKAKLFRKSFYGKYYFSSFQSPQNIRSAIRNLEPQHAFPVSLGGGHQAMGVVLRTATHLFAVSSFHRDALPNLQSRSAQGQHKDGALQSFYC